MVLQRIVKEVTEMDQTDLQRIKSLAGVDNKEIAGMNLPLLMKGLEQAQQGQQMSSKSLQVGVLLQLIEPIAKAGNLQQLITLSKRSEKEQLWIPSGNNQRNVGRILTAITEQAEWTMLIQKIVLILI